MVPGMQPYQGIDQWARELFRARYAAFIGLAAAGGVAVAGPAVGDGFPLVRTALMGGVICTLESLFGRFSRTESAS